MKSYLAWLDPLYTGFYLIEFSIGKKYISILKQFLSLKVPKFLFLSVKIHQEIAVSGIWNGK